MTNGKNVGAVNAEVRLETKQFKEALTELKESISNLKNDFNKVSTNTLVRDVEILKKQMNGLVKTEENLAKTSKKVESSVKKVDHATQQFRKNWDRVTSIKFTDTGIIEGYKNIAKYNNELNKTTTNTNKASKSTNLFETNLFRLSKAIKIHNHSISSSKRKYKELENEMANFLKISALQGALGKLPNRTKYLDDYLVLNMRKAGMALNRFTSKTKVDYLEIFKTMNTASQQFYSKQRLGISDYNKRIESTSQSLRKMYLAHEKYYASVGAMSTKYWNQIRGSSSANNKVWNTGKTWTTSAYNKQTVGMSTYYGNINKINTALEQQRQKTERLKTAQYKLHQQYHTNNLNYYKQNMAEINRKLQDQTKNTNSTSTATKKAGNSMLKTASSSRILSNTLYQIRGALLSLKMIFTAMGGMALWGFASQIAEGVKETVTAKNEMEAQLTQIFTDKNGRVDTSGIQYFRKELEKLPQTYKKVNKYQVGETASSIGLEFDLSAKQMADALPIITMISSEYVRAGRKESEAALAVKDILQGEFQRLSRETGVGKEELKAYGWNGDTKDVESILKAVKKAGLDRHWDVFAKKATSLNDVLTITKSRFSEFGADLVDSITPLIVGGFNTLIEGIDGITNAFNSMGSFGQNLTVLGGGTGLLFSIGTALPMIIKGMGFADIATIGWSKSIAATALNLNKLEVGQYGFRKALAATITGVKASEIANVRSSKAILGRLLGVKQSVMAEHGLMSALVHSKATLKGHTQVATTAAAGMGTLQQKLIYLAKGEIIVDKQTATWGKTIKSIITSTKLWRLAIMGVIGTGLIVWLAGVSTWADTVKKRIEAYNDVLAKGKDKIKEWKKDLENTNITKSNKKIIGYNINDMQQALKLAKQIKKTDEDQSKNHDATFTAILNKSYKANGQKNIEKQGREYLQMKQTAYDIKHSEEERAKFQYASLQHINEHVNAMKKAGAAEKDRIKYITEYSTKAEEAANHLKQFNQGDVMAGMYYVMDQVTLAWIDLWNDKDFVNFWNSVNKTFNELKPTLYEVKDLFVGFGREVLRFFSTDVGRYTGLVLGFGTAFSVVGLKIAKWVTGEKSVFSVLKKVGGKLKDVAKGWKSVSDNAEKASEKMGGTTPTTTSTGGINSPKKWKKGEFKQTIGNDAKDIARKYAKVAVHLASAMFIVTEAILLLNAPMLALAGTGALFKMVEPQVRDGIEGLKLITPTVTALLVPVMAFSMAINKWEDNLITISSMKTAGKGIAVGMLLVAETILMLNAPLLFIASVGYAYNWQKDAIHKGAEAMKIVSDSLYYLVPFIPALALGVALMAGIFSGEGSIVGGVALAAVASGIALGMLLVSETVVMLKFPLAEIANLGNEYSDLTNVKAGAEAIKVTAEAMGYVEEATSKLALIKWELLAGYIADLIGISITGDLTQLTAEGGFFEQLNKFTSDFNKLTITTPDSDKVTALSSVGTGIDTISSAMKSVKTAMDNIPPEFKNGSANVSYDMETDTTNVGTKDVSGYFDTFKEPLKQLSKFVKEFNESDEFNIPLIDSGRVANISKTGSMVEQLNTVVQNVKNTMQGIGDSGHANAFAQGGYFGALGYDIVHMTGVGAVNNGQSSGEYKSSLGSQLKELEDVVSDLFTFQSNVNGLTGTGGENANVDGASAMVTTIQTAISNLSTTLSNSIPTFEGKGNAISQAIIKGLNSGLNSIPNIPLKIANKISNDKNTLYATATALGKTTASKYKTGVDPMSQAMYNELLKIGSNIDDKHDWLGTKAYDLGSYMAEQFKNGAGIHSPGIMANATRDEMGYIAQFLNEGSLNLPQMASGLAQNIVSPFTNLFNEGTFSLPNMDAFKNTINTIPSIVANVKTGVSTEFNNIQNNIGNSFNTIVGKTRTSLSNMKNTTIGHIANIKTSWRGMQSALIASAENIKTQTGQKINKLKTNLGDFWNKLKHPDQLINGFAGGHNGTIRRNNRPIIHTPHLFAGGNKSPQKTDIPEYLQCLMNNGNCYAGGWNFNWKDKIQKKFNGWNTHFGKWNLDNHLRVGKFSNSNFPVTQLNESARANIAKQYIFDTIANTTYDKYFNSKFGDDPVAALLNGSFNCWDGTQIVLAIARAFGFNGSMGHGTWNGIGHVWASIPGLGIIDPTAIQQNRSFKSSSVKGYAGGSKRRGGNSDVPVGDTYNTTINVTVDGSGGVSVDKRRLSDDTGKKILDILGVNPATGR